MVRKYNIHHAIGSQIMEQATFLSYSLFSLESIHKILNNIIEKFRKDAGSERMLLASSQPNAPGYTKLSGFIEQYKYRFDGSGFPN